MGFTKKILDNMLEDLVTEYFSDFTQQHGLGLWEVIEYIKLKYQEEINTLED